MKHRLILAALLACGLSQPALAQGSNEGSSNNKAGVRIEGRVTLETPTVSSIIADDDVYKLGSSLAYGGELGFDIALGDNFVLGPFGTYEVSTVENCDGVDCVSATDNYAFGLHGGFNVGSDGLIYLKVGYASLGLEADVLGIVLTERGEGPQFAIGYEQGFGENFYGRVEFGYADNGDIFGINFQRRHAGLALGVRF